MLPQLLHTEDLGPRELAAHVLNVPVLWKVVVYLQTLQVLLQVLAGPLQTEEGLLVPVLGTAAVGALHNLDEIGVDGFACLGHLGWKGWVCSKPCASTIQILKKGFFWGFGGFLFFCLGFGVWVSTYWALGAGGGGAYSSDSSSQPQKHCARPAPAASFRAMKRSLGAKPFRGAPGASAFCRSRRGGEGSG